AQLSPIAASAMLSEGKLRLSVGEELIELDKDCLKLEEEPIEGLIYGVFSQGRIYIDARLDEKLAAEGLAREIVRRIQEMRKQANLKVDAFIEVCVTVPSEKALAHLEQYREFVSQETRAKQLSLTLDLQPAKEMKLVKEWDIGDEVFIIGINYDVS
ncbi:MAG: isoleucine--tRNA ligase, partial [Candidatus Methanomethylicota archaeon]